MKYSDELLGSAGVEDTTYKIDKYFRRIETIEMSLSERGRKCAHQYQDGTNYFILFVELSSEDRTALETELLELKRVLHHAQETVRQISLMLTTLTLISDLHLSVD